MRAAGILEATRMASSRSRALMRKNPPAAPSSRRRAVGGVHLATPDAHGRGRLNGLEAFREDAVTALPEHRVIGAVLRHEGVELALGHGIDYLLLTVDQAQVLH
jgi:hypothetical protein